MDTNILHKKERFNQFVETYYNEIFHYIRKQLNSTEDAKDITQDVFLKAYNKLSSYNPSKASLRTWVYRIAYNQLMNHFKSSYYKKTELRDNEYFSQINGGEDILEVLMKQESVKEIILVMNKVLNKKHLLIMNLYFFSDLTPQEISNELGFPVKTVRNVISLSINKIKAKLEDLYNG